MHQKIAIVSSSGLENWDWKNPWTKGIGGSETSAIEMADGLFKRGFAVDAFTPCEAPSVSPAGVSYRPVGEFKAADYKVVINYRTPSLFDAEKPDGASWWFVAQDVDYAGEWTDERLEKVDRFLALCKDHATYTQSRYPALRGKVFTSSNGVRAAFIEAFERYGEMANPVTGEVVKRAPRVQTQVLYASSPDRGLKLILENWFRVRERVPEAELRVAYGFDNMEKIVQMMGGADWRAGFQVEMKALLDQPGVTFTGRLNQLDLYREWFSAGVWFYGSDWRETSCCTVMDAMATGCWPVANRLWAVGEHLDRLGVGDVFSGVPQESRLVASYMIEALIHRLEHGVLGINRLTMAEKARRVHDWERVVDQWERWVTRDLKESPAEGGLTQNKVD